MEFIQVDSFSIKDHSMHPPPLDPHCSLLRLLPPPLPPSQPEADSDNPDNYAPPHGTTDRNRCRNGDDRRYIHIGSSDSSPNPFWVVACHHHSPSHHSTRHACGRSDVSVEEGCLAGWAGRESDRRSIASTFPLATRILRSSSSTGINAGRIVPDGLRGSRSIGSLDIPRATNTLWPCIGNTDSLRASASSGMHTARRRSRRCGRGNPS